MPAKLSWLHVPPASCGCFLARVWETAQLFMEGVRGYDKPALRKPKMEWVFFGTSLLEVCGPWGGSQNQGNASHSSLSLSLAPLSRSRDAESVNYNLFLCRKQRPLVCTAAHPEDGGSLCRTRCLRRICCCFTSIYQLLPFNLTTAPFLSHYKMHHVETHRRRLLNDTQHAIHYCTIGELGALQIRPVVPKLGSARGL